MSSRQDPIKLELREREVVNIEDGEGLRVACLNGYVWITQASDVKDVVIQDGESFVLDRQGLTLVSAPIGPASVAIHPAADCLWVTEPSSPRNAMPSPEAPRLTSTVRLAGRFTVRSSVMPRLHLAVAVLTPAGRDRQGSRPC